MMNDVAIFQPLLYIGIDVTAGKKPFTLAALDQKRAVQHIFQANMDDMLAFISEQQKCWVAICAPYQPNQGLMKDERIRQTLIPPPAPARWRNYRLAEYILRSHRIPLTPTCGNEKECPRWIQKGFLFYKRLLQSGFKTYPTENAERQFLEVYPQAAFAVLLGHNPLPKNTLEGRLQRQLLLYELDINISDPLRFFEEITRHKLLMGNFPYEWVLNFAELDALVAAYCAWLAANQPSKTSLVGDPAEGQIFIPAVELKSRY